MRTAELLRNVTISYRGAGALLLAFPLVLGCGNSASDGAADRMSVGTLGAPHGVSTIRDAIHRRFVIANNPSASETQALLVTGDDLSNVITVAPSDVRSVMWEYLNAGKPVVLVDSTSEDTKTLTEFLGVHDRQSDPHDSQWRSLLLDELGRPHWTEHRAQFNRNGELTNYSSALARNESDKTIRGAIYRSYEALWDHLAHLDQARRARTRTIDRAAAVRLANSGALSPESVQAVLVDGKREARASTSDDASDDITSLESAQTKQTVWDVYDTSDLGLWPCQEDANYVDVNCEDAADDGDVYARYTITSEVYTFNDADTGTDYHFIVLQGNLAQSQAYTEDSSSTKGWFATEYGFYNVLAEDGDYGSAACVVWGDSSDDVETISICEDVECGTDDYPVLSQDDGMELLESLGTEQDCTTTTYDSSFSFNVSGAIGGFNYAGSQMSISESVSYTADDVCLYNYSGDTTYNPAIFIDTITAPTTDAEIDCYYFSDSPSGSATATYSPTKMWIWSTDSDIRSDTEDDYLILCGALYYAWEKIELSTAWTCYSTKSGYEYRDTSSLDGFLEYHAYFELVDVSD